MSVYHTEDHKIILPKFVSLIKNTEVPVNNFCKDIVKWLSSPKHKKFESREIMTVSCSNLTVSAVLKMHFLF